MFDISSPAKLKLRRKRTNTKWLKICANLDRITKHQQRHDVLYNNQINARALIGQSAVDYGAAKPTEKSRVF